MSWQDETYKKTQGNIVRYYEDKAKKDPETVLMLVEQELQSQQIRLGNDWTGRGVVIDTIMAATISALEIIRAACLKILENTVDGQRQ